MATPGISAPTTGRVRLSDDFLEANYGDKSVVIDLHLLTPIEAFSHTSMRARGNNNTVNPTGVLIDAARGGGGQGVDPVDLTATQGSINGCLVDEPVNDPMPESYACRSLHPCRYRYVYPYQTTARGIKFHSAG